MSMSIRRRCAAWAVTALAMGCLAACSGGSAGGRQLAGVGTLPAPTSAWPEAGFDARHSSGTTAVGPQRAHLKWHADLGGDLTPGPVIGTDGSVLAASHNGVLSALDPATGRRRWSYDANGSYGSDLSTSPAVLGDGTILWPGPGDALIALTSGGRRFWTESFDGAVLSPAVAGADRVYVADLTGHLVAFDIHRGQHRRVWSLDLGGPDYASPSVGPDGTVFTAANHDLVAVRDHGNKGAVRWRYKVKDLVEVSNGVSALGVVTLGTNNDKEYGIDSAGKVVWSYDKGDYTYAPSVVRPDGTSYFGDNMGRLTYLSKDGAQIHRVQGNEPPVNSSTWTQPAVDAHGNVYFAVQSGQIYGFDAAGRQLFSYDAGAAINSYPAIGADGTVYFGTTNGRLLALGV